MANRNYTLKDKGYFNLIGELASELRGSGIRYALVGGAGIQARVCDVLSKAKNTDVSGISEIDLLRKTKDIDIASDTDDSKFTFFFNRWQAVNPNVKLGEMYGKRKNRKFRTTPCSIDLILNYQTEPSDLKGLDENAFYESIDTAQPLELWYGNTAIDVYVAQPEYMVASKLTRAEEKDIYDISLMLKVFEEHSGKRIDFNRIKFILERAGKDQRYKILEEIIKGVLKK